MPEYNLRAGILIQIVFLIVAAMLLMNVVSVLFTERDLVKAKIETGQLLIRALEIDLGPRLAGPQDATLNPAQDPAVTADIMKLLQEARFDDVLVLNRNGKPVFEAGAGYDSKDNAVSQARESLINQIGLNDFFGSTWGVIWLSSAKVRISAPLLRQNQPVGAVSISGSLVPIYQTIRRSEKILLIYILLDTIVLSFVGFLLLSRLVVKPIHHLLQMADIYKEGDPFLGLGEISGQNEISRLSSSLGNMIKRLDQNKNELRAYILSLEKANQDLHKAQNDLIRSEKLASVGRLAAGIAHEIGNPLGIVLGYLELISKGDISETERGDFLSRIEQEVLRINQTIRQLLDFSRPATGLQQEVHLQETLQSVVDMLCRQPLMADVQVAFRCTAQRDVVRADPNQLQQVFLNIILNAADALARQDQIAKTRENTSEAFEKRLIVISGNSQDRIVLEFGDNGPGVADGDLLHIFDPFFTTKEPGKGTGLGLAVCHQIITELGGNLWAENNPTGQGLSIFISLPLFDANR